MTRPANQSLTPFGTGSRRGRWQTACERLLHSIANWWSMNGPFALNERAHGPMRRSDKGVFIITATVAIWLVLFLLAAAWVVTP